MNYYELLKIARNANDNEIKRAYFSAVKLHSPDSDPEGFKAIRIAYETLSDQKKRAEYDAYFIVNTGAVHDPVTAEIQNDILAGRCLIRENKYKQAMDFLTELSGKYPDSPDVTRLLAEVFWLLKKSGKAEKLCEELLGKNPSDGDTMLLYAKIAESRGYTVKAGDFFNNAVLVAPLKREVWINYMRYALHHAKWQVPDIFNRAMKLDTDMFRDDYIFYLLGAYEPDTPLNKEKLQYYDKFAEYFIIDKNPDEDDYWNIIKLMPKLTNIDELIPFIIKILPALEKCKHRSDKEEEDFKYIRIAILSYKLRHDDRIHDVIANLSEFLLYEDNNKNERLSMECYIAFNLAVIRPSVKILMKEYPECFKLNQVFYLDVLNEKKAEYLINKHIPIYRKIKPEDDYLFEEEEVKTVIRSDPKTGRNDPCPCGSGKKYKKCCGT